jgi:hypothetical protein
MVKIDKSIPIPQAKYDRIVRYPVATKWPFAEMEVGDSFQVSADERQTVMSTITYYRKFHTDVKFTVRKYGKAYRCWRTA